VKDRQAVFGKTTVVQKGGCRRKKERRCREGEKKKMEKKIRKGRLNRTTAAGARRGGAGVKHGRFKKKRKKRKKKRKVQLEGEIKVKRKKKVKTKRGESFFKIVKKKGDPGSLQGGEREVDF